MACSKVNCPYTHDSLTAMAQRQRGGRPGGPGFAHPPRQPRPANQAPDASQG